jgi:hypothetical protein
MRRRSFLIGAAALPPAACALRALAWLDKLGG